jgi:hypothetical protein
LSRTANTDSRPHVRRGRKAQSAQQACRQAQQPNNTAYQRNNNADEEWDALEWNVEI